MITTVRCNEAQCFAYKCLYCQILTDPIRKKPCPFFKTGERLIMERADTVERLKDLGHDDLIALYIDNAKGYAL